MRYFIADKAKNHIAGHFDPKNAVGSSFRLDIFPTVETLLSTIEKYQPINTITSSNNRTSDVYLLSDIDFIGWFGVGLRSQFMNHSVNRLVRNGFTTEFIEISDLPVTNYLTIVYEYDQGKKNIITLFPGNYAPAFPHKKMTTDEFEFATQFWEAHILLKKSI